MLIHDVSKEDRKNKRQGAIGYETHFVLTRILYTNKVIEMPQLQTYSKRNGRGGGKGGIVKKTVARS